MLAGGRDPRPESAEIPKCPKLGGAPGCRSGFAGQREVRFTRLSRHVWKILDAFRLPVGRISTKVYLVAGIIRTKRLDRLARPETDTRIGGERGRGCVGSRLAGRSGREAKRAAAPGLGGSCGAQPRTHLRQEALDLDGPSVDIRHCHSSHSSKFVRVGSASGTRRGIIFIENDASAAPFEVIFHESDLIKAVEPAGPSPAAGANCDQSCRVAPAATGAPGTPGASAEAAPGVDPGRRRVSRGRPGGRAGSRPAVRSPAWRPCPRSPGPG